MAEEILRASETKISTVERLPISIIIEAANLDKRNDNIECDSLLRKMRQFMTDREG